MEDIICDCGKIMEEIEDNKFYCKSCGNCYGGDEFSDKYF